MERLGELLSSDLPSRFEALTQQDEDAAGHLKRLRTWSASSSTITTCTGC